MRVLRSHALSALLLLPGALPSQTRGESAARSALRGSHLAALTPLMTPAMVSRRLDGAQLGVRYGFERSAGVQVQALAASAIFAVGLQGSFGLHAGFTDADCTGCSPQLMVGAGGDMRIMQATDALGSGNTLNVALSGDVGYAQLEPSTDAVVLGIGAPVTLVMGGLTSGMRISPFVVPTFGVGHAVLACPAIVGADCSNSGMRWMLGTGIGFWNPESNLSVTVGVQSTSFDFENAVAGVNVILGGR